MKRLYIHVSFPRIILSPAPSFCSHGYTVHEKIYDTDDRFPILLADILKNYPDFRPSTDDSNR